MRFRNTAILVHFFAIYFGAIQSVVAERPTSTNAPSRKVDVSAESRTSVRLIIDQDGRTVTLEGQVIVEDTKGGILLQTADGGLWTCGAGKIKQRESLEIPIVPLTADELGRKIVAELGAGFEVYQTQHYCVVHNTNTEYVRWSAGLFERLQHGFYNYWKTRGLVLKEPPFPLVALVFNSLQAFDQYAKRDTGKSASNMIGYYNIQSNRMVMYVTPDIERRVATIIHEAAHQIAYNSSLQTRLADNPMWVSEGLAIYFESPDLSNSRGWGTIGKVNEENLRRFHQYLPNRPPASLATLIQDDQRFTADIIATYGESWALNYFLLRTKSKQYSEYLIKLSQRLPLQAVDPQQRLDDFAAAFGNISKLDAEFLQFMAKVR